MTQTKPAPPAARDSYIDGELTDVRRLLNAMNKIMEDYVGEDLEAYEHYGDQKFADLQRGHVERMLARAEPHAARDFLMALRAVIAVAVTAGLRPDDPTAGIQVKDAGIRWIQDVAGRCDHPV